MPVLGALVELWHDLVHDLLNPYHPEQHYMRGPGPAWQAKHAPAQSAHAEAPHGLHHAAI
jgi:hypothetical protein